MRRQCPPENPHRLPRLVRHRGRSGGSRDDPMDLNPFEISHQIRCEVRHRGHTSAARADLPRGWPRPHPKPGHFWGHRAAAEGIVPYLAGLSGQNGEFGPAPCITDRPFLPIRKRRDARETGHIRDQTFLAPLECHGRSRQCHSRTGLRARPVRLGLQQ